MTERSLTRASAQPLAYAAAWSAMPLRRMRDALDDDLLVRNGRSLDPTPRALELWPVVRDALQRLRDALQPRYFVPAHETTFVLTMADNRRRTDARLGCTSPRCAQRILAGGAADHARPAAHARRRHADPGHRCFPAVITDITARAPRPVPATLCHRLFQGDYVCVMRAYHPFGIGTPHAGPLLPGAPHAGQLLGSCVWLCGQGTRSTGPPAPCG